MDIYKHDYPKAKIAISACAAAVVLVRAASAQPAALDIISTLSGVQALMMHIGPLLSAILFTLSGLLYAVGQLFPSHQRANFHTIASDMIMGAVVVGVLSVAANGFAIASTHLLSNSTANLS